MIVDCAHYRDGERQHEGPMSPEAAATICREDKGFVWLGMVDPSPEELDAMQKTFGLHELAVEDAQSFHLRPKVEKYDEGVYFVVLRTARYIDEREEVEFGEISVFMGPSFVITVRQGSASDLHDARLRLEQRPKLLQEGPPAVLWAIVDKVVDDYEPVMAGLENDVEEVEVQVFGEQRDETRRVYFLRREMAEFHRAVHPLLQPLEELVSTEHSDISQRLREHMRDVADHVKRVEDAIATQRELLTSILQANLAVISVQQNDVVKKISGWAAIITVPTLIASIYGMNFDHMPELRWRYGYPAVLVVMFLVGLGLHRILRRADWL
jgi:magnesium transporter